MFSERSASDEIDPDSIALAAALAGLVPQHTVNRDRLMFLAGQASVTQLAHVPQLDRGTHAAQRRKTAARVAAAVATLAASLAGALVGWQMHTPAPPQFAVRAADKDLPPVEPLASAAGAADETTESRSFVGVQANRPPSGNRPAPDADYLDLRRRVLSYGVGVLSPHSDAGRRDDGQGRSFLQLRGQLLNQDGLPSVGPPLDLGPLYPAGART
jgi:hypothetical protein